MFEQIFIPLRIRDEKKTRPRVPREKKDRVLRDAHVVRMSFSARGASSEEKERDKPCFSVSSEEAPWTSFFVFR